MSHDSASDPQSKPAADTPGVDSGSNAPSQADLESLAAALEAEDGVDDVLKGAQFEDPQQPRSPAGRTSSPGAAAVAMPNFDRVLQEAQASGIDLLRDVNLEVKIELGRSKLLVEDVLKLVEGSVVELDKLAGDPVDVFVNDRLVARGEVLVLNENFCVRVNEIIQSSREEDL